MKTEIDFKVKVILVDDEPLALKVIESYLEGLENIEILATFTDAIKAFTYLQQNKVDLLFLDIQMPMLNGLELIRTMVNPPAVIITTAFREYAVESFDLDVIDYLLKPISFERFLKSIQKYYRTISKEFKNSEIEKHESKNEPKAIFVKENKKMFKLAFDKIKYIESLKDYVRFHTNDKNVICKMSMVELENRLPIDQFMRVHRSYIIPIKRIQAFSASSINLPEIKIPIGNTYKLITLKRLKFLLK